MNSMGIEVTEHGTIRYSDKAAYKSFMARWADHSLTEEDKKVVAEIKQKVQERIDDPSPEIHPSVRYMMQKFLDIIDG